MGDVKMANTFLLNSFNSSKQLCMFSRGRRANFTTKPHIIIIHKECKCKEFCSQTRLGGEICSSDVNTRKGGLLIEKYHQIRRK